MRLENQNIRIEIDPFTGVTSGIWDPAEEKGMNWVLAQSFWGHVEGFVIQKVEQKENAVYVTCVREEDHLQIVIEKKITDRGYFETYRVTNLWRADYFLTKENFGIPFPYQCLLGQGNHYLDGTCLTHVWCGGDVCWMYSGKNRGDAPFLVMHMIRGAAEDYSISYDISRTLNGSHFRGTVVLHPRECVIPAGETVEYAFFYRFSDQKPEEAPLAYEGALRLTADRYSVCVGEKIKVTLEGAMEEQTLLFWEKEECYSRGQAHVTGEVRRGKGLKEKIQIPYAAQDGKLVGWFSPEETGEYRISAQIGDRRTWLKVKVLLPLEEILERRARFIVENQQYLREGSTLHGAYLIYDDETGRMYCKSGGTDHNALHERMAFGIIVCKQLQRKYDEKMMESLRAHKAFLEREFLDPETGRVYNEDGKAGERLRIYNFAWVSVFYLEWYHLTGERDALETAVRILLKYYSYNGTEQDSQGIEMVDICRALEKEGMSELLGRIKKLFIAHGDSIMRRGDESVSEETAWEHGFADNMCVYLCQVYVLTGEKKYLERAARYLNMIRFSYAKQPDFHQNCVALRYWDRYWFGKYATYGDLYPHYWSDLNAWALDWYHKAKCYEKSQEENGESTSYGNCEGRYGINNKQVLENDWEHVYREEVVNCLTGNLCLFREDGFAYNNYLYPYKVVQYSSNPSYESMHLKPGTSYGANYDPWSNDQDWALYYALMILGKDNN